MCVLLLYLTLLVFQCAVVPQWAWRSSHWTRRHWWWAGNAPWPSTTRPSPVTWSPTAGWKVMLLMKRRSPRLGTRERWVLPTASQNRPKPESFFFFCFHIFLFLFQHGCGLNSSVFFFKTSDVCGRIRGWLDQWQCVEEVTGCDELCLWLLDDMRAQTLPCHSPV